MTKQTMTFGKYRGLPIRDVPLGYLAWAVEKMTSPPRCVIKELERRVRRFVRRDAAKALHPITDLAHPHASPSQVKSAKSRPRSHKANPISRVRVLTGERYDVERKAWLARGGDPNSCPWDAYEAGVDNPLDESPSGTCDGM